MTGFERTEGKSVVFGRLKIELTEASKMVYINFSCFVWSVGHVKLFLTPFCKPT